MGKPTGKDHVKEVKNAAKDAAAEVKRGNLKDAAGIMKTAIKNPPDPDTRP
jgi:hypothetical protein